MIDFGYTIWIPLIPFFMFLILGLFGGKMKPMISGYLGTLGLLVTTVLSFFAAYQYFFQRTGEEAFEKIIASNTVWLNITDKLHIDVGVMLDPISVMMLIVVSTVSFMVHIYSLGYMKGDFGFSRFYSFLSLFSFSMYSLVVATNLFQMYMCWELVGVSSYLLISFYYEKPSAVLAGKKAFIVTRFADLGFLIGILILSYISGTFDFEELTNPEGAMISQGTALTFMGFSAISVALTLIFIGGAGKSAMFPLHIWLPDAMEGPTPVSALIHAATMVVAGVFLVARLFPLYYLGAPDVLTIVAYVGGFTSLFAAIIACTQLDIKRVLAFSTMSQIGYMMLALGVSGYGDHDGLGFMASMFHLFTHAMFKALLFLGAGAIIHSVHSNMMTDMGGLRKYLPITHITFLIACLTIAGIPPFSGFFSKDEILVAAFHHDKVLFFIEWAVAGITAFYMFRLYFVVFWGKETHYHHTPHESPLTMTIPLMILALASIFSGFIPFNELVTSDGHGFHIHTEWAIAIPSILVGIVGIAVAWIFYKKESGIPAKLAASLKLLYVGSFNKFYIDELYMFITKKIIFNRISAPIAWFDRHVVDASMNGIAWVTNSISDQIKELQSGQLQKYGYVFISGVILLTFAFVYLWFN
ncbi:MAG: NADH-quinone oxidoreductase subunit L [Bacteroidales bacterium]|nr:NADH-quinone oxidoreductase subunit L [Bacteroidales bacterium]MCF8457283.1 NADH-quinone oxidoreductase subunit L [Bacteroidales bacterium]